MQLSFHERTVHAGSCSDCGAEYENVTGFINSDEGAYAVYYAACHGHPEHEARIDVILGTWGGEEPDYSDHVTFACTLRPDGAMAEDAPLVARGDEADGEPDLLGKRLSRDAALGHPQLVEFWSVIDFLAESDANVRASIYGPAASPDRT